MPDLTAAALVDEALALRKSHPHAPAVDLLDLVIKGRGVWLEDFFPHMVPPSPFALLVAEAMEDCMTTGEWQAFTGLNVDGRLREEMRRQYEEAVLPKFVGRYGLSPPQNEVPRPRSWFTW